MVDLYGKMEFLWKSYIIYIGMHSLELLGLPGTYAYVYMHSLCMYICKRQLFQVARTSRAGGNGPAAPVFAGPVFLKVKTEINTFLQKANNKYKC